MRYFSDKGEPDELKALIAEGYQEMSEANLELAEEWRQLVIEVEQCVPWDEVSPPS